MPETSHKSEMADALRGDFRRLRERGVESSLGQSVVADTEPLHAPTCVIRDPADVGQDEVVVADGGPQPNRTPAPLAVEPWRLSDWLRRQRTR